MTLHTLSDLRAKFTATWEAALRIEGLGRISPLTPNGIPDVTWEIDSLMEYQRIVSFLRETQFDMENRERYLVDYISPYYSLDTLRHCIIPRGSFMQKIVRNIAMLYKSSPDRWLADEKAVLAEDKTYQDLIEEMELPRRMKDVYQLAVATNLVAVRPLVAMRDGEMKAQLHVLTPNQFRVVLSDTGDVVKILYSTSIYRDGYVGDAIVVWTAEDHYMLDIHGDRIPMEDNPEGKNPYGIIPFVLVQLEQYDDEIYAGGMNGIVEACLRANYLELAQNEDITFSAIGAWVATNLGLADDFIISPRMVLSHDKVMQGEGQELKPTLENVTSTPQSALIGDVRESTYKTAAIAAGISPAMLETQVRELSGRALRSMQSELFDIRQNHSEVMESIERRIYAVMATVFNYERRTGAYKMPTDLPLVDTFQIDFAEATESDLDEDKRFELEEKLVDKGLLSATDWYRRYNSDVDDEDEILSVLQKNVATARKLKSGGFGSSLLQLLGDNKPDNSTTDPNQPDQNMPQNPPVQPVKPNAFGGAQ